MLPDTYGQVSTDWERQAGGVHPTHREPRPTERLELRCTGLERGLGPLAVLRSNRLGRRAHRPRAPHGDRRIPTPPRRLAEFVRLLLSR